MTPNPKVVKKKLSKKDYHFFRLQVYYEQYECCANKKCRKWLPFNKFSLHHYDRAVGDVRSNVAGFCLGDDTANQKCHPE